MYRVVHFGAGPTRHAESHADLHAFDGLRGHYRLAQPAVQFQIPLRVSAQAERHALDANFDHAAQRVAGGAHLVDQGLGLGVLIRIERIQFAAVAQGTLLVQRARFAVNDDRPHLDNIPEDCYPERTQ